MERKLIISVINGILRNGYDSGITTLSGIALWLCRQKPRSFEARGRDVFDYESLFADGEDAAQRIEKNVPEDQLALLKDNYALTAEILLMYSFDNGFRPAAIAFPVSAAASQFLFSFLAPYKEKLVYNPFAGDYYAPARHPDVIFGSPSLDVHTIRFAQLYQMANGRSNSQYYDFNPFLYPGEEKEVYNSIYIPAMPFGMKIPGLGRKMEENYILNVLKQLRPGGKMVFVLPSHSLSSDNYFELRKTLLEKRILRRVLLLGPRAITGRTSMPMVAFVIENTQNDYPFFLLQNLTKLPLTTQEEAQQLYNTVIAKDPDVTVAVEYDTPFKTPNVHIFDPSASAKRIDRPGFKYVKLASLLTPYSNYRELDGTEMVARLSGKDMHLKLPEYMIDIQDVEVAPLTGKFNCINEPIFCFHGITQNYVWCVGEPDYPIYCNSDVYTFRISSNLITPEYLCFVLGQEDLMADIRSRIAGTVSRIAKQAFLDVEIPVPDRDRQDLITQDLQQYISTKKTMLAEMEKRSHEANIEDIREDINDKVHLLGPYNANIQTGINRVIKMLQRGDSLEADTKVFRDSDIELMGFLKRLLVKSQDAGYIMASIGETIFEEAKRPLDIFTFIQEYVASLQSDDEYEGISFEITPIERPVYLMITDRSLRLVLDTIVRNAVSHGFPDSFTGAKRIKFTIDSTPEASHAVISVANNGMPAAEGFSDNLYVSKFGKCGPTAHSGRGGYFVSKAMDFYKGYVFVNTSNAEWPFDVWLHIPMSNE